MVFRALRSDEVEVRIGTVKAPVEGKSQGGVSLLLYKDARCDMNVLDETVGEMNWQKSYSRDNRNCTVSIWDDEKKQWISKEDTGTESNTEAEKGLASDSFKRACFNWGIGRELYTAPFIFIRGAGKYDRFWVKEMEVTDKRITKLVICSCDRYGNRSDEVAFQYPKTVSKSQKKAEAKQAEAEDAAAADPEQKIDEKHYRALEKEFKKYGLKPSAVLAYYGIEKPSDITYQTEHDIIVTLEEQAEHIKAAMEGAA